ncbi:MAG: cca [Phycisphaerales bacterium]|nr:cca [Phycisphaerales bacterium]
MKSWAHRPPPAARRRRLTKPAGFGRAGRLVTIVREMADDLRDTPPPRTAASASPPAPATPSASKACHRADALAVVRRLREAGHVAYFAGGCVRDLLLGREPKDWDVATDAPPPRVRGLFPRTQAVGAAFGVILVRIGRSQVEVATFRSDGRYVDGRRPEEVAFTTADRDAERRDFTINGLFLDPLAAADGPDAEASADAAAADDGRVGGRVIDFVGGRDDLKAGVIRAIGDPGKRFDEDHLRVLRAVRFAARLGFAVEPTTAAAIRLHAPQLARISPERVAEELRAMLPPPTRPAAWRMLVDLGLAAVVFRFVAAPPAAAAGTGTGRVDDVFAFLDPGDPVPFPLALAAAALQWLRHVHAAGADVRRHLTKPAVAGIVGGLRKALRPSNEEADAVEGTLHGLAVLAADEPPGVAGLKRFLARPTAGTSRRLLVALAAAGAVDAERAAVIEARLAELAQTDFAPPPLVTGDDLTAAGASPGPAFKRMLDAAYDAQLAGDAVTRDDAMAVASRAAAKP